MALIYCSINIYLNFKGDFDVKDTNVLDEIEGDYDISQFDLAVDQLKSLSLKEGVTHKGLSDDELKTFIDYIAYLDTKLKLYELDFNKVENLYINDELVKMNEAKQKHMKQISSIVSQVELVLNDLADSAVKDEEHCKSCCLVELGAGRGKLSLWFEQSRQQKKTISSPYFNILLIERGSQKHKVDMKLKKDIEETNAEFERIRIDLKDLFINKVELIEKSDKFILYGKHLCGVATDFSLRCICKSLQDSVKFKSILLAVCCHHKCEYASLCGKKFLNALGIDKTMFYIVRSLSSWSTSGSEKNTTPAPGIIFKC